MESGNLNIRDEFTDKDRSQTLPSILPSIPHEAPRSKRGERSCILCHRRKVRCDKRSPCSCCTRAGVLCCYPGPEQPIRRPHKTTIADVAARLARLERTIVAITSDDTTDSPPNGQNQRSTTTYTPILDGSAKDEALPAHSSKEALVHNGVSSHYFNEVMLSRVLDEVQHQEGEIMSILSTTSGNIHQERMVFNLGGVLSSLSTPRTETRDLLPSKWHAMQLWQTFVNNVDPLTKILHVPTAQVAVFSAINNPDQTGEDVNFLLFAIYFAATTSLSPKDVENLLGLDKTTALNNFKQGFEESLARANLLEAPNLRSLQAFTIYLLSVRAQNAGRSVWILNGLAIRSAQSIGMHRDGRHFNLSPFESEMRRRVWWHLNSKDVRASEDHGITISNFDPSTDIKFPLNVDDSEIYPSMKELPLVQSKWSESTFSLISFEINHALQLLYHMASPFNKLPSEDTRKVTVEKLQVHIEDYLQHCNLNIPIQKASSLFARLMIRKVDFVSRQQWLTRSHPENWVSHATEENIVDACEILELNLQIRTDELLKGFRWSFETYPPYHVLLYVLWHLCVKPTGPSLDHAWAAVKDTFDQERSNQRVATCGPGSKWAVLKLLREKATRIRDSLRGVDVDGGAHESVGTSLDNSNGGLAGFTENGGFDIDMNWGTDSSDLLDWNSLVDDFQLQRYDF